MQQEPILPQSPPSYSSTPPPTPQQDFNKSRRKEGWRSAISTILIIVIAPIIALILTAFVFQSYEVDGPSMEPTLQDKDRLIVWKLPKTVANITNGDFIPDRGDIVIFVLHNIGEYDPSQDKQLIKRVIGLPGERVTVQNNLITVYNDEYPEGFNPDLEGDYEIVENGVQHRIDITIGEGEIFVAGDNRPNSLDSRSFGTVKSEDIIGTLSFRVFPLNKAEAF